MSRSPVPVHRVVVVGAGYAGLMAAARLGRSPALAVTLVEPSPVFIERIRLHQWAAGQRPSAGALADLVAPRVTWVRARVAEIDLAGRRAVLEGGEALAYDQLVLAVGSVADRSRVPGAAEHGLSLQTAADCRAITAAARRGGPAAVVGLGLTGIEAACELAEAFPGLQVTLLGRGRLADAFAAASRVYIGPLFNPAKIPEDQRLDPVGLARAIAAHAVEAAAYPSVDELGAAVLAQVAPGDTVLILSSGSFGDLGSRLLQGLGDAFMFATAEDMPAIQALCSSYGLAPTEFDDTTETLILREPEGDVVGCCSLKVAGTQALLFNLAVERSRRGEGLGWILADGTIRRARNVGVRAIYLATSDAADFFANHVGFVPAAIDEVDPQLQASPHFAAIHQGGVCMSYDPTWKPRPA